MTMRDRIAEIDVLRTVTFDAARRNLLDRQHSLGKLTARERIDALCDPASFREIGGLARPNPDHDPQAHQRAVGDGVVLGWARIDGRKVAVASWDFTVFGGSMGVVGGQKLDRIARGCVAHGIPLVMVLDGGGHRIQEGLNSRHFAWGTDIFAVLAQLSGWVPVVAVIAGPGFAGPSNFAAMADFVVMIDEISTMGIAGPALVEAATGEKLSKEELGGADLQARQKGIADLAVPDEAGAYEAVRRYLSYLPSNASEEPPATELVGALDVDDRILDIIPESSRRGYDVRRILELVLDEDSVFEKKPTFAANLITAFGRLDGRPVGIVANQPSAKAGALTADACDKGAHFVSLCDAFGIPLIYFIDVPGFLAGPQAEQTALARRSGKLVFELSRATVPTFSVVLRKGYGLAYIAMNGGRSFAADLAVAWPSAEICAMSVEGALDVAFRKRIEAADDPADERARMAAHHRSRLGAAQAAEGFGIDDVIDPRDTRRVLRDALFACAVRKPDLSPPRRHPIAPI